jgi:hypothetical protein
VATNDDTAPSPKPLAPLEYQQSSRRRIVGGRS